MDRLAHIDKYTGLVALLYRSLREQGSGGVSPLYLCACALIALAYALFDELRQELTPG